MDNQPEPGLCLLATVERSGQIESRHYGAAVVVQAGRVVAAFGDVGEPVFARSAVKPFQTLPLLERGIAARLGLTDRELAVCTASHGGTPLHTETVAALLAKDGLREDDLRCGPHAPFDRDAAMALVQQGQRPRRIHNNCSGKHAGFLHLAADLGVAKGDYLEPGSDAQQCVKSAVAEMAGLPAEHLGVGLDGCGAPTFRLPLVALARAFGRLANPQGLPAVRAAACQRLFEAVQREPVAFAGRGRLCTALLASAPDRVFAKNGAEGVYAVGVADPAHGGFGIAVKVADGGERGYVPVVIELLRRIGLWPEVPAALAAWREAPVLNTQNVEVGRIRCALPEVRWGAP